MSAPCFLGVETRVEVPGAGITDEIETLSDTQQTKLFPSGLTSLTLRFIDRGSSAAKCMWVVFDALDNLDAGTKLSLPKNRETLFLGEQRTFFFSADTPCNRIDMKTEAAETGTNRVLFSGRTAI